MTHVVEVDQSGKVEDTAKDTVLAYSNDEQYSVIIAADVKRGLLIHLRERGVGAKEFTIRVFAAGLYFLLKDNLQNLSRVYIDTEYTGKEADIKRYLVNTLQRAGYDIDTSIIQFTFVGKKSPAHKVAALVARKDRKADKVLTFDEMLSELISREERRKRGK